LGEKLSFGRSWEQTSNTLSEGESSPAKGVSGEDPPLEEGDEREGLMGMYPSV
jgi:hypothetical protein